MTRWWGPPPAAGQTVTGSVVFGDVVQISGVGGDVTVSLDRPPYRVDVADDTPVPVSPQRARAQPSRLLLARHQIVPFTGRERTLDALAGWVGGDEAVSALLVHGAGGQGKTRLAAHVSTQCTGAGWAVWQVTHSPAPVAGTTTTVSEVELPAGAVLAVVDYADRWPASALLALLTQLRDLHTRAGTRVRVLMLARSDGYWWPALADRADSDLGIEVDQLALPALAADSADDRPDLFVTAAAQFAAALDVEPADWPVPDLAGPGFGQVLAVHMTALATVDATRQGQAPPTGPGTVSAYLLRREQAYWHHLHTRAEAPVHTPSEVMHRTVVAATLTGVQARPVARQVLTDAGFAGTTTAADRIIDDHTTCYPPADTRTVLEPLHPDRLGEDLIALSTPGHDHRGITNLARDWTHEAITALLTSDPPPAWAATAVTVLIETAHRWPHIATSVLYPLVRDRPELVFAAGGAALTRLTSIPGIDPGILEILEPRLPGRPHLDLDIAAAAITSALTRHRLAHTTDPAEQARLHAVHAFRLANAGRREQALVAAEEAAGIYGRLAEADPDVHLPDLAMAWNNLGNRLSDLGRREQALAPAGQAVGIYRRLAEAGPQAYLPHLAKALNNLGIRLSDLGRREQALGPAEEAVIIYRRLAEAHPDAYLPDLAMALNNVGAFLSELGRREQALAPAEEAVMIYRGLSEAGPQVYLPDLAMALNNLGIFLSELGRPEQALGPAEEAVVIRRSLAEAGPQAHLPDLAMALSNLGVRLSELGRREQALAPAEEAVIIYRRLAEAHPQAYLPDLARSLQNLGAFLSELGRREQALAPTEEAVIIYRRLAEAHPQAYLPDLAGSLNNLGIRLSTLGRPEQALATAEDATGIYRRLAEADPDAYLPHLARSLGAYALVCVNLQANLSRGLESVTEAISLYRPLTERLPQLFAGQLLTAYQTLADVLDGLGRAEDAAELRRQLTADDSGGRPRPAR